MVKHNITMCDSYGILHLRNRDFLFDAEDLPVIQSRSWYCDKDGYLVSTYYYHGRKCWVRFHRLIMKAKRNQFVDHVVGLLKIAGTDASVSQINLASLVSTTIRQETNGQHT